MNGLTPQIDWSDAAWLTYERMPADAQSGIDEALTGLAQRYIPIYANRPVDIVSVGTISHVQVPGWGMWLRFETEYTQDEEGPWLFVIELEELTQAECEASVAAAKVMPGRIN